MRVSRAPRIRTPPSRPCSPSPSRIMHHVRSERERRRRTCREHRDGGSGKTKGEPERALEGGKQAAATVLPCTVHGCDGCTVQTVHRASVWL
jgi:hypothetical protein